MNEQLERLIRLQSLDREAGRLRQQLAEITPKIEDIRTFLVAAERSLAEGKGRVDSVRKERRAEEKNLEAQIDKRRKFQEQQSKVKTNKEYQALMGELETLKTEETGAEDRILVLMEQQAEAEQQLPAMVAEVGRAQAEFQEKERVLRGIEEQLRRDLAAADASRAEIVAVLEPGTLQTYQRIAKLRGSAVAEVRDEFCLGCSTKMPSQNFVEAMRNDRILYCPHCHRILHYVRPEIRPAYPAAPAAPTVPEPAA